MEKIRRAEIGVDEAGNFYVNGGSGNKWQRLNGNKIPSYNYYGSTTGAGDADSLGSEEITDLTWYPTPDYYPGQGDQPFDLSDMTNPIILADGIYNFCCEAKVTESHVGKHLWGCLFIDRDNINDGPAASTEIGEAGSFGSLGSLISLSCERFLPAGTKIHFPAVHTAGVDLDVGFWVQLSWYLT